MPSPGPWAEETSAFMKSCEFHRIHLATFGIFLLPHLPGALQHLNNGSGFANNILWALNVSLIYGVDKMSSISNRKS